MYSSSFCFHVKWVDFSAFYEFFFQNDLANSIVFRKNFFIHSIAENVEILNINDSLRKTKVLYELNILCKRIFAIPSRRIKNNSIKSISIYIKPMQKICVYLFHLFRCYLLKYANSFHGLSRRFGINTTDYKIIMHTDIHTHIHARESDSKNKHKANFNLIYINISLV